MLTIVLAAVGAAIIGLVVLCAFIWRVVVPTNMVHIVQSSKKTVSYGRDRPAGNTYYAFPSFLPVIGIEVSKFPESIFDINLRDYEAYDAGRLPFVVDIRAFFRVTDSQVAAQRVSNFAELQNQLIGVLQGAVRRILATNTLENIMEARGTLGDQFTAEVNENLQEWGVSAAKTIEVMDIRDSQSSQVIQNIMAKEKSRIEMESRTTVAANFREAETREVEAKRDVELSKTEAEQTVGIRRAEKDKTVGIADEKAQQEIQEETRVTTEKEMGVVKVREVRAAEIAKDVAIVKAEEQQRVQVVDAQAIKESQIIKAEAEKDSKILIAEGDLQATFKDAKGIEAEGAAKAEAERLLLQAPVDAQITLAKEIGANEGYQTYLINIRQVEATEQVGKAMAVSLEKADLKVIANGGDVQSGVGNVMDMFTSKGGTSIAAMLEGLGQTDQGKAVLDKVTGAVTSGTTKKK